MKTITRRLPNSLEAVEGLRAAKWVRVSTVGQADNFGPDAQLHQIDRAISRYGLVDTSITWLVAHSGRNVTGTAEWRDMLDRAGTDYDVLLVGYASRFQRNLKSSLVTVEDQLHPAGVPVLFADERLLSSDPDHWEQFVREATEAEAYSRKLSRRVREGLESKRRRTGVPGGNRPPYGFIRTNDRPPRLLVDQDKMEVVERAFVLSAAGMTDRQVADAVTLKKAHVAEILTNPVYCGRLHRGEQADGGSPIEPTLWDRVQERRRAFGRRRPGRGALRTYPLAKLVHCAACGRLLTAHTGRLRHVDACEAFTSARPRNLKWATRGESYDYAMYDDIIPAVLAHVAAGTRLVDDVSTELELTATGPDPSTLARIERDRDAALERYKWDRDGVALQAAMARLDRDEEAARSVKRELPTREEVRKFLGDLPGLWAASDPDKKQALVRSLFDRIEVLGVEEVRIYPTREALDYGWFEAWQGKTLSVPLPAQSLRNGRGERI